MYRVVRWDSEEREEITWSTVRQTYHSWDNEPLDLKTAMYCAMRHNDLLGNHIVETKKKPKDGGEYVIYHIESGEEITRWPSKMTSETENWLPPKERLPDVPSVESQPTGRSLSKEGR